MAVTQEKTPIKVAFVQHGCDKNRVDSEKISYDLKKYGFEIVGNFEIADVLIINTCAFIKNARIECSKSIKWAIKQKKKFGKKVFIIGCYTAQLFEAQLKKFGDVDGIINFKNYPILPQIIAKSFENRLFIKSDKDLLPKRLLSTGSNYAFLQIADGCNNYCSYCTIPYIRGAYKSVPIEELLLQAKQLVDLGISEIILIAQDVTKYGYDFDKNYHIVELIRKLSKIDNLHWIRLQYCYPELVSDELIDEISTNKKVCKYIDMPLQHISDNILNSMNRKSTEDEIEIVIEKLQKNNIFIRSTFMVGFAGESKEDFEKLCCFLLKYRLDRVGFFAYSREKGTKAYLLKHQISNITKAHRLKKIQSLQKSIMLSNNKDMIGQEIEVVVQEKLNDDYYQCRSEYDSPEVDSVVYVISDKQLVIGTYLKVKVIDYIDEDLEGEIL